MMLILMAFLNKKNIFDKKQIDELYKTLTDSWVGVLPTDTIYGLSASVFCEEAIERIYKIKRRKQRKPLIVLIGSLKDLEIFGVALSDFLEERLKQIWPGKVSVVLKCQNSEFNHLYCGGNSLAFRMPDYEPIQKIIKKVGPIVSTSANIESKPFARNVFEARRYFGDKIDFCLNDGELIGEPSSVLRMTNGTEEKIR